MTVSEQHRAIARHVDGPPVQIRHIWMDYESRRPALCGKRWTGPPDFSPWELCVVCAAMRRGSV